MADWLERKIPPMLATSGEAFDSPEFLFEIKWDGIRTLAFCGRGKVRLQGRKLTESTHRYPEVVRALEELPGEAVLDGEIVVLEEGKPVFERVLLRELINDRDKAALRSRSHPAVYVVFDILYADGEELIDVPLRERKKRLSRWLTEHPPAPLVESSYVLERGIAFFESAVEQGLEGIVAKELLSPYLPGKRTRYWLKIKTKRRLDAVVLGTVIDRKTRRVKSLVLGGYRDGGELVWIGNVGSGLDAKTLEQLRTELDSLKTAAPEDLRVAAPGEIHWLKPTLVARVEFLEWTREGRLRAPVFVGFVDASPESCRVPALGYLAHP